MGLKTLALQLARGVIIMKIQPGLANGYNGYLPTPEQHALGGYETWRSGWSNLEVNASRQITDKLLEMLREVSR